jgi:hypothetical protein
LANGPEILLLGPFDQPSEPHILDHAFSELRHRDTLSCVGRKTSANGWLITGYPINIHQGSSYSRSAQGTEAAPPSRGEAASSNGPGACGTPRVGRKLAQPDIFRQGQDRRSFAVRVRVGSVIDPGARRDSPFPIFLAGARDQTVIPVQRAKSRPCARPPLVPEHDIDRAVVSVRWIPARPKTKNKG